MLVLTEIAGMDRRLLRLSPSGLAYIYLFYFPLFQLIMSRARVCVVSTCMVAPRTCLSPCLLRTVCVFNVILKWSYGDIMNLRFPFDKVSGKKFISLIFILKKMKNGKNRNWCVLDKLVGNKRINFNYLNLYLSWHDIVINQLQTLSNFMLWN